MATVCCRALERALPAALLLPGGCERPRTTSSSPRTPQEFPLFHHANGASQELCLDEFLDAREVVQAMSDEYAAAESADYLDRAGEGEALAGQLSSGLSLGTRGVTVQ